MKVQYYTRDGNTTMCWVNVKPDLGFIGFGEHEDPKEAKRLAYEDACRKASVISISQLSFYRQWKQWKKNGL